MTDRRERFANSRVRPEGEGEPTAEQRRVRPRPMRVVRPLTDLLCAPGGARDRQLLFGERVETLEERDGHVFLRAARDGYVGYAAVDALIPCPDTATASHWVAARASHIYSDASIKSAERMTLPHGAALQVAGEAGNFLRLEDGGFVPSAHCRAWDAPLADPAAVAEGFIGTPYLWGGNSGAGIDCSGLVQAACLACGIPCPRDSDQQEQRLGEAVAPAAAPARGDLLFWRGHVGLMLDGKLLLHANAHHMAVAVEPAAQAIARIAAGEFGEVTSRRRLPPAGKVIPGPSPCVPEAAPRPVR